MMSLLICCHKSSAATGLLAVAMCDSRLDPNIEAKKLANSSRWVLTGRGRESKQMLK